MLGNLQKQTAKYKDEEVTSFYKLVTGYSGYLDTVKHNLTTDATHDGSEKIRKGFHGNLPHRTAVSW